MIAIITGASRGIGRAIAHRLASDYQAKLFLVYRSRREDAEQTATECEAAGATVSLHQADVSDATSAQGIVDACIAEYGQVDVLVNNAGITADGLTLQMSDDDWLSVLNTNASSTFYLDVLLRDP